MAIQINIDDSKLSNFSNDAQATLKTQVERYADEIIKEANLIEEGLREDEASTEITSSFIIQAVRKNRTGRPKKKHKHLLTAKIVSFIAIFFAGILFDLEAMQKETWRILVCMIVLAIAIIAAVLQFIWEDKE